ncbi:type II toxin-antitoxin system VapC family toxin [Thiothrix winogradskyi]|jgi:hypothetical protein|uniref:Type II toxin-antitoxin system VapC family toxin n=1 Tax=Thiothrix winogradskyi TaxID=96472 RepID=A0ABY3SV22_9GAMM|nr:type II toxin-antitoxin system VapC family toxin [Thiothrix winogradskyi]UJS23342.1 type II toxin-antitoxin system VapC family toxin [Thiothrix winogradskyi]
MLCDTNIISELARLQPNPGVAAWSETVTHIHLSVITVEEIHFGLAWKNNARIRTWFEHFLQNHCTVLPVTPEIARLAGEMRGSLQTQGSTREQADMLIAATAAVHGLPLVTRNEKDFVGCCISVINPFS